MKQLITLFLSLLICIGLQAQDDKYNQAIKGGLAKLKEAKTPEAKQSVANLFERISQNEPDKWEASYYHAFVKTIQAFEAKDKQEATEGLEDLILTMQAKLETPSIENDKKVSSEIHALIAMMYSARMSADPMNLGMKLGPLTTEHIQNAIKYNLENPRAYVLQAQNLFYTPEAFGGNKTKAKQSVEMALQLFKNKKNDNELWPSWGKGQALELLKKMTPKEK